MDIIEDYQDNIIIVLGAHTHFIDIRYNAWEDGDGNWCANNAYLLTPSISPIYENNPGYTVMEVFGGEIVDLTFTFLDLSQTYGENPVFQFFTIDAFDDLGFDAISPDGFLQFTWDILDDEVMYQNWISYKFGFEPDAAVSNVDSIMATSGFTIPPAGGWDCAGSPFICFMTTFTVDDYTSCITDCVAP